VQNFASSAASLDGVRVASIGPITSNTARRLGIAVTAEAHPFTIDGLVDAILQLLAPEFKC
jgi:uroporphyrinogen III methyltransferase/synthase